MKRNLIIVTLIALIASACSTSVQMTGRYVDDLYYWPGDSPAESATENLPAIGSTDKKPNDEMVIISEVGKDNKGNKTLNNYIYADDEPDWYSKVQAQNIENMNSDQVDTVIVSSGDDGSYLVNNYYLGDDYSYADRFRNFYDSYYYDPFWNNSFSFGWNYPYNYSWGYPYSSFYGWNSFYWDPWYSWGYYNPWGWGYSSWYSPYYCDWYSPYYYHNNHWDNHRQPDDSYISSRRSRNPNATYGGGGGAISSSRRTTNQDGIISSSEKSANRTGRRTVLNEGQVSDKSAMLAQGSQKRSGAVLSEKRRSTTSSTGSTPAERGTINATRSTERASGITPSQNIERRANSSAATVNRSSNTPSYNKPRTNTRASYNSNRTSETNRYATPSQSRTTVSRSRSSENATRSSYQIPSTNSGSNNMGNVRRSNSSGNYAPARSYSSGSSTPSRSSSYSSSPSRSSSYSSPSRSSYSSSPSRSSSYSSGGSSSSGSSSSGSSSSGSSSSGHSSSGGRR